MKSRALSIVFVAIASLLLLLALPAVATIMTGPPLSLWVIVVSVVLTPPAVFAFRTTTSARQRPHRTFLMDHLTHLVYMVVRFTGITGLRDHSRRRETTSPFRGTAPIQLGYQATA